MQPLGRKKLKFPGKVDHHIVKRANWWEEVHDGNKSAFKRDVKSDIKKQVGDLNES